MQFGKFEILFLINILFKNKMKNFFWILNFYFLIIFQKKIKKFFTKISRLFSQLYLLLQDFFVYCVKKQIFNFDKVTLYKIFEFYLIKELRVKQFRFKKPLNFHLEWRDKFKKKKNFIFIFFISSWNSERFIFSYLT